MPPFALLIFSLLVVSAAAAEDIFIDKGACPGEGCLYGESWIARKAVRLLSAPDASATPAGTVGPAEAVETLTGEVHTVPGRFVVQQPHGEFSPGDEVLVYTYLGEGWFRIRHNGELKEADLGFSPWGGSPGKRCEVDSRCWGSLQQKLRFDWWIKVRTRKGLEGWLLDASAFDQRSNH